MRYLLPIILSSFILLLATTTGLYFLNPYEVKSEKITERLIGGKLFRIPSRSMQNTLVPGDYIIVSKHAYQYDTPKRNDIVVFNRTSKKDNKKIPYIKRVLAIEGDNIKIENGKVFINEIPISEPYVNIKNRIKPYSLTMKNRVVPEKKLFLLGDNRDNSNDSRLHGFISVDDVIGKATRLLYGENGRSGSNIK